MCCGGGGGGGRGIWGLFFEDYVLVEGEKGREGRGGGRGKGEERTFGIELQDVDV